MFTLFALAAVTVFYWRVVLTVVAITLLGLVLVGAVQVAQWFQALT